MPLSGLGPPPPVPCFLTGTHIATPTGSTAVEDLRIGDTVLCADGRAVPLKWIGHRAVSLRFADPEQALPVRIAAGALGNSLPVRDLLVSPDHAMLLEDVVLVQAGALVNGRTIRREEDMPERYTYWHLEAEGHEIILAEGAPTETFIDNLSRRSFDNWQEYEALHPHPVPIQELDLPRVKFRRQLPRAVSARLEAIADAACPAAIQIPCIRCP